MKFNPIRVGPGVRKDFVDYDGLFQREGVVAGLVKISCAHIGTSGVGVGVVKWISGVDGG